MPTRKTEKYLYLRSDTWWIKLPMGGGMKPLYESTGVRADPKHRDRVPDEAKAYRDKKLGMRHRNELSTGGSSVVTIKELLDDLLAHLKNDGKASTHRVASDVINAHLVKAFGATRAARLTTDQLKVYRKMREKIGRADSTINRELEYVRMALRLGVKERGFSYTIPAFPMRAEDNTRQGFLEQKEYERLLAELPERTRPALIIGYHVGMRRGEVIELKWHHVNLEHRQIRLFDADVKNSCGRTIPIYGPMVECLTILKKEHDEKYPHVPWVLHRNGKKILEFRAGWKEASAKAGLPGLLFHDLRRSAARNMDRASISRSVIMAIMGHKTDSMFTRYRIVSASDINDAGQKLDTLLQANK